MDTVRVVAGAEVEVMATGCTRGEPTPNIPVVSVTVPAPPGSPAVTGRLPTVPPIAIPAPLVPDDTPAAPPVALWYPVLDTLLVAGYCTPPCGTNKNSVIIIIIVIIINLFNVSF